MRARGAKVTDIVVLVVAADDGVMPQTREAIDHAQGGQRADHRRDQQDRQAECQSRAGQARADRARPDAGGMGRQDGHRRSLGARRRPNIDLLLEMILLVSEIGELKANPKRNASGTVLEAKLDKGRGPVATVLVQDGTLNVGDTFIAGPIVGRVRALIDDRGRPTKSAGPSTPVEVLGLTGLPQPGDVFQVADAAKARQIAAFREEQAKTRALGAKGAPPDARVAAGADRRRRHEGAADHHQGRRAGFGRSAGRHAREADRREGEDPDHPRRRRRGERIRRAARRRRRTRSSSRSTSGPTATRRRSRRASTSTSASTRSSTTSPTR